MLVEMSVQEAAQRATPEGILHWDVAALDLQSGRQALQLPARSCNLPLTKPEQQLLAFGHADSNSARSACHGDASAGPGSSRGRLYTNSPPKACAYAAFSARSLKLLEPESRLPTYATRNSEVVSRPQITDR